MFSRFKMFWINVVPPLLSGILLPPFLWSNSAGWLNRDVCCTVTAGGGARVLLLLHCLFKLCRGQRSTPGLSQSLKLKILFIQIIFSRTLLKVRLCATRGQWMHSGVLIYRWYFIILYLQMKQNWQRNENSRVKLWQLNIVFACLHIYDQ